MKSPSHTTSRKSEIDDDALMSTNSLSIMLEQEQTAYTCCDYLTATVGGSTDCSAASGHRSRKSKKRHSECITETVAPIITPADRMKIVDWCYALVDQCNYNRENVAIAMNIVDRFAAQPSVSRDVLSDRSQYQLVAVTALYIANKVYGRVVLGSDGFSALSHGTYSVEEIEAMELRILHGLSWRLSPPTSLQIGYIILALIQDEISSSSSKKNRMDKSTWDFLRDEVAYQTENAVREYYFTTQRSSTIAVASILNAIEMVDRRHYEDLLKRLLLILKAYNFEPPLVMLDAKERLQNLVGSQSEEHTIPSQAEDDDNRSMITQEATEYRANGVVNLCQDA